MHLAVDLDKLLRWTARAHHLPLPEPTCDELPLTCLAVLTDPALTVGTATGEPLTLQIWHPGQLPDDLMQLLRLCTFHRPQYVPAPPRLAATLTAAGLASPSPHTSLPVDGCQYEMTVAYELQPMLQHLYAVKTPAAFTLEGSFITLQGEKHHLEAGTLPWRVLYNASPTLTEGVWSASVGLSTARSLIEAGLAVSDQLAYHCRALGVINPYCHAPVRKHPVPAAVDRTSP